MELYKEHRPVSLKGLVGQDEAKQVLIDLGRRNEIPHAMLFSGPSGCGKTTIARILRRKLKCSDIDFHELNSADFRGIDMVRDISRTMPLAPIGGACRIWLIDEAHQLTTAAQDAFLKPLEDTPSHVYFFLCTTDPQKLKATIRTRCMEIKVSLLNHAQLLQLINDTCDKEDVQVDKSVADKIANRSEGSARKALVLLESVIGISGSDEQLEALDKNMHEAKAIDIARCLLRTNARWPEVAKLLSELTDDVETVRWTVLGYCKTIMLKGGKTAERAYRIIDSFREPFYDSKLAGLVAACWEVMHDG